MRTKATAIGAALAALAVLCALFATSASASPAWRFNGEELKTTEVILGAAQKSGLSMWGMTTTCDNFLYEISISNKEGTGEGNVTDLPLFSCYTNTTCTVEAIEAESFPWKSNLTSVGGSNYLVVKGVDVWILYGGWFCPLWGSWVHVTGSAGGLITNATESATFGPSSFKATGTELKALGESVEWNGFFPSEAFQWNREDSLSVS